MWKKIPPVIYVGVLLGAMLGGWIGELVCLGYNLANAPLLPQAGVDPQPAGWEGWWIAGGATVGAAVGWVGSLISLLTLRALVNTRTGKARLPRH